MDRTKKFPIFETVAKWILTRAHLIAYTVTMFATNNKNCIKLGTKYDSYTTCYDVTS